MSLKLPILIFGFAILLAGLVWFDKKPSPNIEPSVFESGQLPTIADYRLTRFILTFEKAPDARKLAKQLGVESQDIQVHQSGVAIVSPIEDRAKEVQARARLIKEAQFELDEPVRLFVTPNDPQFVSQQKAYLDQIRLPDAWRLSKGKSQTVIAIVDTGVNGSHEDLTGKVLAGWNYIANQAISANSDSDDHGHGSEVAGVAAAFGDNNLGIAGVDWNARIMPVKVLNNTGEGSTADAVSGITYAADNGAMIINLSFGRSSDSPSLKQAIEHAKSKGVIVVAAVGNDGKNEVAYPAAYDDVIAVGAVDREGKRASFSNYGVALDVVAPGSSIRTTSDSSNGYINVSGTSVATPIVSGAFGLAKDLYPNHSADELKNLLLGNLDKLSAMGGQDRTDEYGKGLINALKLLTVAEYKAEPVEWSSSDGRFRYPSLIPGGEGANLVIVLKNTGRTTWKQGVVNLGAARDRDRIPGFLRESLTGAASGWVSANRVRLKEAEVKPGETGTFDFWLAALTDKSPGTYREYFAPVADGVAWFSEELGIYWDMKVLSPTEGYQASPVEWSSSDGSHVYPTIQRGGSGTNLVIKLKNTGKRTWKQGVVNLGTARERDRIPGFERESGTGVASGWLKGNRIKMQESEARPGETATFSFWLRALADKKTGTEREYFAPVADGVAWFSEELGIYWDVTVR